MTKRALTAREKFIFEMGFVENKRRRCRGNMSGVVRSCFSLSSAPLFYLIVFSLSEIIL